MKVRWKAVVSALSYIDIIRTLPIATLLSKLQCLICSVLGSTYIAKVHDAERSQSGNNLASDFVGDVELRQGHVRRAEHGVLLGRHAGSAGTKCAGSGGLVIRSAVWWRLWCVVMKDGELPRR